MGSNINVGDEVTLDLTRYSDATDVKGKVRIIDGDTAFLSYPNRDYNQYWIPLKYLIKCQ